MDVEVLSFLVELRDGVGDVSAGEDLLTLVDGPEWIKRIWKNAGIRLGTFDYNSGFSFVNYFYINNYTFW